MPVAVGVGVSPIFNLKIKETVIAGREFYISSSTGNDSTGDGTIGNPFATFTGAGLGLIGALKRGDKVYFKRGDTWTQQEVRVNSSGTKLNPIVIDAYGTGDNPLFIWAQVKTGWTYTGANDIYFVTAQNFHPGVVGIDGTHSLCQWTGSTTVNPATISNLLPGTYRWRSDTKNLYIRLDPTVAGDPDPNNHTIYVPQQAQSNIFRGVIRAGMPGSNVIFNNLKLMYSNGIGFSCSLPFVTFNNCEALGTGRDGFLTAGQKTGGELASWAVLDGCKATYCAAAVGGGDQPFTGGGGQGFTINSPYAVVIRCTSELNWMAGIDFLDYDVNNTESHHCILAFCTSRNNGRWTSDPSYDPNVYFDGCHDIFMYGNIVYGAGTGVGDGGNARSGCSVSSEHADTRPVYNIYLVNNFIANNNAIGFKIGNLIPTILNIKNVELVNNTIIARRGGGNQEVLSLGSLDRTIQNNVIAKNNIFYAQGGTAVSAYLTQSRVNNTDGYGYFFDFNKNQYFRHGSTDPDTAAIYHDTNNTNYTLASWRSLTGLDANSAYGDPYFVNNTEATFDVHLQRTALGQANNSPAIGVALPDPFTPPDWVNQYFPGVLPGGGKVVGTTRTDGVATATAGATQDIGYHFPVA